MFKFIHSKFYLEVYHGASVAQSSEQAPFTSKNFFRFSPRTRPERVGLFVKRGGSEDWEPGYEVDFNPKADGGESEICLNALCVHWIGA
jgi:hypothetical protein